MNDKAIIIFLVSVFVGIMLLALIIAICVYNIGKSDAGIGRDTERLQQSTGELRKSTEELSKTNDRLKYYNKRLSELIEEIKKTKHDLDG